MTLKPASATVSSALTSDWQPTRAQGEKEKPTAACLTRKSQSWTLAAGYQGAKLQLYCLTLAIPSAPRVNRVMGPSLWEPLEAGGTRRLGLERQLGEWAPGAQHPPQRSKWGGHLPLCWYQSLSGNVRKELYSSNHVMLKLHRRRAGGGLHNLDRVLPRTVKSVFSQLLFFLEWGGKKEQSFIHIFVGYNFLTSTLKD